MDIEKLLKKLIGHKVELSFISREEFKMRQTMGVLIEFDEDVIHCVLYDNCGDTSNWYLNRHVCTLYSIMDYGEKK